MTKQITAAEKETIFSADLKPAPPPSMTSPAPQSAASTQPPTPTPAEKSQASKTQQSDQGPPDRLKCQWELLSVIVRELLPVIKKHYDTVLLNGEPLDINWDYLFAQERAGACAVWTARTSGGAIVGYALCMGARGMFSHSVPRCEVEAIWLDPAWRSGMKGVRFLKGLVDAVRRLGVSKKMRIFSNDAYDVGPDGRSRVVKAFRAAGFRQTGTIMELDF